MKMYVWRGVLIPLKIEHFLPYMSLSSLRTIELLIVIELPSTWFLADNIYLTTLIRHPET